MAGAVFRSVFNKGLFNSKFSLYFIYSKRMRAFIMMRKSNFSELSGFLFIFCFLLPFSAESGKVNQFIKGEVFTGLRDFENLTSDKEFKFVLDTEKDEVDISDFITILNRAKKSQYDNFPLIDVRVKPLIFREYIHHLCKNHAEDPFSCEEKTQIKIEQAIDSLGEELSKDIRYPHNYYPIDTPEGGKTLSEVYEILQSKCPPDCQKIRFGKGSQSEFDRLIPLLEKQKSSCLKEIVKNMFKQLKSYRLSNSCKNNTTHPVCKNMSKDYHLVQDRLLRLTELVYGKSARLETKMQICSDCPRLSEGGSSKGLDLQTIENVWQQSRNCEDIQPGEKKRVSSGTGLNKEYTVRREKDGSYSVILNLQFVAADNYEGPVEREEVPSYYRNQVQKCLNEKTNKKLLGPDGEKMQIVLQEKSSEQSPCPEPPEIIKIGPPGIFSFHNEYVSNIRCHSISHEILHQMGLCDEYFNEARGYIMDSKTGKIIEEVADIYEIDKLDPGQSLFLAYDCRVIRSNSVMAHNRERWGNVFHRKTENSLVTPEQFSAILYGDCKSKNQLFNECSKLAYRNSFEDETCLEKKKECERKKALGD